jgi:glycosyltransferase involved in cell wall biosynthesis
MTPTVSVCVPTYNGAAFLAETLESVLGQTYDDFELVVVDDASTDATLDIARKLVDARVRVVVNDERLGASANFARAVSLAQGKYVKLLCQDDTLYPECLGRQVAAMEAGAAHDVVLVGCKRDIIDEHGRVIYGSRGWRTASGVVDGAAAIRAVVRAGTNLIGEPSSTLCRRDVFEKAGGYASDRQYMIDLDAWVRMLDLGRLSYVAEPLCTFRVSRHSWSARLARDQARQARAELRSIQAAHSANVTRADLFVGIARSIVYAWARRAVFAGSQLMLRSVFARSSRTPSAPNSARTSAANGRRS